MKVQFDTVASADFKCSINAATVEDITFAIEIVDQHADSKGLKFAYKPTMIGTAAVPKELTVLFIRGGDDKGAYWCVVSWINVSRGEGCKGREYEVNSDREAREAVLRELKTGAA